MPDKDLDDDDENGNALVNARFRDRDNRAVRQHAERKTKCGAPRNSGQSRYCYFLRGPIVCGPEVTKTFGPRGLVAPPNLSPLSRGPLASWKPTNLHARDKQ